MDATIQDGNLLAYGHRAVLRLDEQLVVLTTAVERHGSHGIHVAGELRESLQLTILSLVNLQRTSHLLHGLDLSRTTHTAHGDTDVDGWTEALVEEVGLQEYLTVGDGNHVGRDVGRHVACLCLDDRQSGERSAALDVTLHALGQVVIDNKGCKSAVTEILTDGYTDKDGNVSAFYTLTDTKGGTVKAEVVLGAEGEEAEEGAAVDEEDGIKADDWTALAIDYRLTPSPASQDIEKGATAAINYKLERYTSKTGEWSGYGGQTVQFEATNGSVTPTSGITAQDGTVAVTFTPNEDATEGTITATTAGAQPDAWSKISSATVKIKEEGGGDELVIVDEGLKKADKLKDNVYVVDENEYNLIGEEDYAYWSVGSTGSGYNVDFCKEHPEYATVGWGGIFNITDEMVGKEIDYLAEKANGNENLFVSLGTFVDPAAGWEAPNNMIEFNADDLTEAKFMIKDNGDGTMSALAHLKRTDGHEGWFKLKATKSPW